MAIVKRYELVLEDLYGNKTVIPIMSNDNEKYEKAHLTMIDKFTMQFKNGSELLSYLTMNNYTNFTEAKIYIRYIGTSYGSLGQKNGSKEMKIEPVYSNQTQLGEFLRLGDTYVDKNNSKFRSLFDQFLIDNRNGKFIRFADEYHFINKRLLEIVRDFINGISFDSDKIEKDFSRYKAIRGYIIGKQKYKEYLENPEKYAESNFNFPIVEKDDEYIERNTSDFGNNVQLTFVEPTEPENNQGTQKIYKPYHYSHEPEKLQPYKPYHY